MPFFTQGDDHQDPILLLRSGPTSSDVARMHAEWERQAQADHQSMLIGIGFCGVIALLVLLAVVIHRRKILRSVDTALVAGLATGVRAGRVVASQKAAFAARVLAKADEPPTSKD